MTNNQTLEDKHKLGHGCCCSCISWSGIISGAFVALGLSFLLFSFASAMGLSAFKISTDRVSSIAVGGFIAMLVGGIIVMFVSGWVAGFLNRGRCADHRVGALSGFLAWSLSLIIAAMLTSHFGQILNINYTTDTTKMSASRFTPGIYGQVLSDNKGNEHTIARSSETRETRNAPNVVEDEKAINEFGKALFLTFILFLAGAIASAIGGYWGMCSCPKNRENEKV